MREKWRNLRRHFLTPKQIGPYIVAANEFGTYCVPRKALHRRACRAIMRGEAYEADTIRFLTENASGDIVHGGTFFGDFLPALAHAYDHVWAFEPNPDSFRCAQATAAMNGLGNVTLTNWGLGRSSASLSLCTERDGEYLGGASFIVEKPGDIRIETIDSIVPPDRKVGMIQLDVEGYEAAALEGARETIRRCRPIIVLETPAPVDGYVETRVVDENHVFTPSGRE